MKTKTLQLKEIKPNPFRDFEQNPLDEKQIEGLVESIGTVGKRGILEVRLNDDDKPELVSGHHLLEALKRVYSGTKELDFAIVDFTDGKMIQWMARENLTQRGPSPAELFEAIKAAVAAHGSGKIGKDEMPFPPGTDPKLVRFAPKYTAGTAAVPVGDSPEARAARAAFSKEIAEKNERHAFTVEALAKFLGLVKQESQRPKDSFVAAFGALELVSEGYLTEARTKGLDVRKLGEVVAVVKKQREAVIAESKRLAAEIEARRLEVVRKAEELKKQQAEAEAKRVAAVEAERLAAIKRAEEKAKHDAEEAVRRAAEEKRKKAEAEQRAIAEAKRKDEEEKLRKAREAQRVEAERQRIEADRVRQIALAKAKKEEDEAKAEKMRKDAEAAKVRAEAEAKRKEEAARQAEIAAKKREADEKERQAQAAKKRAEDEARQAAQRKAQQEAAAREEIKRVEEARRKAEVAKLAAAEADRKKQAEIAAAQAEAKRKDAAAKKEEAERKADAKEVADKLAEEAKLKTTNRDDIRDIGRRRAEEKAAETGRRAPIPNPAPPSGVDADEFRKFLEDLKKAHAAGTTARVLRNVPEEVVQMAKQWVEFSYREFAKKKHPDHGGTQREMQLINATASWLRGIIEEKNR